MSEVQIDGDKRVSLLSYGGFGSDLRLARDAAASWCNKAQLAYDAVAEQC